MVDTDDTVTETLRVARWVSERFQALGYDESHADLLAHHEADWHEAARMIAKGCPLPVAFKLLT